MDDRERHEPIDDGFDASQPDPADFPLESQPPVSDPAAGSEPGPVPPASDGSFGAGGGAPPDSGTPGDFLDLGTQFANAPTPLAPTRLDEAAHPMNVGGDPGGLEGAPAARQVGDPTTDFVEGADLDMEDEEGSWLMSLDDVLGDRAGSDGIVAEGAEATQLPGQPGAAWSEKAVPQARARRVLVPMLGVLVASMIGWAGWRFVDLRGELTTRAPGPLDAGSVPQPRRVVPLDGAGETVGPNTRQSVGRGPGQKGPGAQGRPGQRQDPGQRPGQAQRPTPQVAYQPSLPPAPTIAPGRPFETPPVAESLPTEAPAPVVAAGASGADPAPIPTTLPGSVGTTEVAQRPVEAAPDAAGALAVSTETRGRWRSMFGLGSQTTRARRPVPQARPDQRIIASSTEAAPGSEDVMMASVLPYGLDAAYIDGWVPPLGGYDPEIDPSDLPVEYVRSAGWRDLTGIWVGDEVPYSAIDGPDRMLTPAIGFVAVYLKSGEIVEGVLTEVGSGQVWVQTSLTGRMGLRRETIRDIDVLGLGGQAGQLVVENLSRVRVATAGGAVYGRLVTTDAERATVYTDAGARITVPRGQVEVLGSDAEVRLNRG